MLHRGEAALFFDPMSIGVSSKVHTFDVLALLVLELMERYMLVFELRVINSVGVGTRIKYFASIRGNAISIDLVSGKFQMHMVPGTVLRKPFVKFMLWMDGG